MGGKTKAQLEAELAALGEVLDEVADVLDDDELSASRKVAAALQELDRLEEDDEDDTEVEDD
jgi:hypothetical protein